MFKRFTPEQKQNAISEYSKAVALQQAAFNLRDVAQQAGAYDMMKIILNWVTKYANEASQFASTIGVDSDPVQVDEILSQTLSQIQKTLNETKRVYLATEIQSQMTNLREEMYMAHLHLQNIAGR